MFSMNECVERMLKYVKEYGTPLTLDVLRSIASLCSVDVYELWYRLTSSYTQQERYSETTSTTPKTVERRGLCWKCPACGKEFQDVKTLVSHILYFVRQRDRAHLQVYRDIKRKVESTGKTFTEIVMSDYRC